MKIHKQIPLKFQLLESLFFILSQIRPSSKSFQNWRKQNALNASNFLKKNSPKNKHIEIDRVENLSRGEFIRKYYKKSIPVIFSQEASKWDCCKKWSLDFLANEYEDFELEVIESNGLKEQDKYQKLGEDTPVVLEKLSAKKFVENIKSGQDTFIQFSQILDLHPNLLKDLNFSWLKNMGRSFLGSGCQTFLGGKNRKTPIHSGINSFFYIMVSGKKTWSLYSGKSSAIIAPDINHRVYNFSKVDIEAPNLESYPGFEHLLHYKFQLNKGDILFVPSWMYHEVKNEMDSWGTNYRFNAIRPMLKQPVLTIARFIFSRPNPFFIAYEKSFLSGYKDKGSQTLR